MNDIAVPQLVEIGGKAAEHCQCAVAATISIQGMKFIVHKLGRQGHYQRASKSLNGDA
jgi:hypothetical protein